MVEQRGSFPKKASPGTNSPTYGLTALGQVRPFHPGRPNVRFAPMAVIRLTGHFGYANRRPISLIIDCSQKLAAAPEHIGRKSNSPRGLVVLGLSAESLAGGWYHRLQYPGRDHRLQYRHHFPEWKLSDAACVSLERSRVPSR
jgi:hypothetical protein